MLPRITHVARHNAITRNRKSREPIKEKNWMPLVWRDELFMVHSVFPQRVFRCALCFLFSV
jgi:hypothetical protein